VEIIKTDMKEYLDGANRVLEGGDNYDGADGARYIMYISETGLRLIEELEKYIYD